MAAELPSSHISRRRFMQGAGGAGLGLLAGCGRLPEHREGQSAKVARVGWLSGGSAGTATSVSYISSFWQELGELGYVEGQNITIEYRYAEARPERLTALAAELVNLPVDVIVTTSTPSTIAAKQATSTLPIVMTLSGDPVTAGLVTSLASPGGNITGTTILSSELSGKRLELLTEVAPAVSHVGVLWNADNPLSVLDFDGTQHAAEALGAQLHSLDLRRKDDWEHVAALALQDRGDALLVLLDPTVQAVFVETVEFAAKNRLPTMFGFRDLALAGGLMAYGPNYGDLFRRAAYYVDRILKGARAAELPVERPRTFDFVINLQTAQALGLAIPQHVLLQATELFQ